MMDATIATASARSPVRLLLFATIAAGALAVMALRLWVGRDLPLWVDETWTAVIVTQSSWSGFWREAWLDCNAPLYYAFMALWTEAAGVSNTALRAPSLLFVLLAGIAPIAYRASGLSLEARLTWGALLFFWLGGTALALDARVYALLLLIGTLQTIAFARLVERPSLREAWIWAGLASAAILSHYYALVLVAVQAATLIALDRGVIKRLWRVAIAFVPSLGWLLYHLPRLLEYARPDVVWYTRLDAGTAMGLIYFLIGPWTWRFALVIALVLLALRLVRGPRDEALASARALKAAVTAAAIALALVLAVGLIRPAVTARYLVPLVPSALLGLVLIARQIDRAHLAYLFLAMIFLAPYASVQGIRSDLEERSANSLEPASEFLATARPNRMVFLWDHPGMQVVHPESLSQFGGFFLQRTGDPLETRILHVPDGESVARRLLTAAAEERSAILWLHDARRRAESRHVATALDSSGWHCRRFDRGNRLDLLACAPPR